MRWYIGKPVTCNKFTVDCFQPSLILRLNRQSVPSANNSVRGSRLDEHVEDAWQDNMRHAVTTVPQKSV